MLIRIRSKEGNHRFEVQPTDDVQVLVQKILATAPEADPETLAFSNQPRGGETLVVGMKGTLSKLGLKHGDLLFASYKERDVPGGGTISGPTLSNPVSPTPSIIPPEAIASSSGSKQQSAKRAWETVVEEPVDEELRKDSGKIPRKRDGTFCRHGDKSMCDYCMPLEAYDPAYHKEQNIKHLSFQAHLRKLNAATNKPSSGSSYIPPLEPPDYRVSIPCPSGTHAPFPGGICSKCQPSAITLQLQQFRMVDHVEFASPQIIDNMLAFWRRTGYQRFGYMFGRYERYDTVPLGVKAVVEAVYEPPQQGELDGVQIGLPWEEEGRIENLAAGCGLKVLGMVYTDLVADDRTPEAKGSGKVICKRHAGSFFLSGNETIFAAQQSILRPNPSKFSASGRFSSKFVTCVLTGNLEGGIDVTAYQVSDQAMGMLEADMIEASVEPGTVRLKEENRDGSKEGGGARYVPDVFYRYKNSYGIDVKENAKPCFPVDYLLVSLTHGFPAAASPLFRSPDPFPSANRPGFQDQTMEVAISKLSPLIAKLPDQPMWESASDSGKGKGKLANEEAILELQKVLSDWNLVGFMDTIGVFDAPDIRKLSAAATARDSEAVKATMTTLLQTGGWQTLAAICKESSGSAPDPPARTYPGAGSSNQPVGADGFPDIPPEAFDDVQMTDQTGSAGGGGGASVGAGGMMACPHCTFENEPGTQDCLVCGLPIAG